MSMMVARLLPGETGRPNVYWNASQKRWTALVRVALPGEVAPRKVTGSSPLKSRQAGRVEALARLEENVQRVRRSVGAEVGLMPESTVAELYDAWVPVAKAQERRAGSTEHLQTTWHRYVRDSLGSARICDVTTPLLANRLTKLAWKRRNGAPTSAPPEFHRSIADFSFTLIRHLFAFAISQGLIERMPAVPEVRPTFKRSGKRQPQLSWGEVQELRTRFSAYEDKHAGRGVIRVRSISELLLHTGARIGEILALQRADLDPDDLVKDDESLDEHGLSIYIRATQKRLGGNWAADGTRSGTQLVRQELPKGGKAGSRIVTVSAATARQWILPFAPLDGGKNFIFSSASGQMVERQNVSRAWRKALADSDLSWVHPHIYRHTVAQAIVDSLEPEVAQRLLGHSSLNVTLGTYAEKPVTRVNLGEFLDGTFRDLPKSGEAEDIF